MPFIWHMAKSCLELPYGAIRHFPAGSYYDQTKHWTGEAEIELMRAAHTAWYTFGYLAKNKWTEDETKFMDSLRRTIPIPPTRRLEVIVKLLWRPSPWLNRIIEGLKSK